MQKVLLFYSFYSFCMCIETHGTLFSTTFRSYASHRYPVFIDHVFCITILKMRSPIDKDEARTTTKTTKKSISIDFLLITITKTDKTPVTDTAYGQILFKFLIGFFFYCLQSS